MPQRKESSIGNERSGEIWVLRIFSKGTGILQGPMDFFFFPFEISKIQLQMR